ncbi:hypothetical protein BD414DRAFT_489996 [Trametes punicea]|nr:hypothetical protein BD414DRAFT_489996 [Trametes punicea]
MNYWDSPRQTPTILSRTAPRSNISTDPCDPTHAVVSDPGQCGASQNGRTQQASDSRQPPTRPPVPRGLHYAPAPPTTGAVPSLEGSMRFTTLTAAGGLKGAFSGSWSFTRDAPGYLAEPRDSTWAQNRGQDDVEMDEDEDEGSAEDVAPESDSAGPSSSRPSLSSFSEALPGIPNRAPVPSESDILLRTSTGRLRPATFSPVAQHERAASWDDRSVVLPPIRSCGPLGASGDNSPYMHGLTPPLKRACVQLPSFPEFVEGASRPSFSGSTVSVASVARRGTSSPPPSPSPSVASWSTAAHSDGHTDTEPTDEDDAAMSEHKRNRSYSPLEAMHASRSESHQRPEFHVSTQAIPQLYPSLPIDDDSDDVSLRPQSLSSASVGTGLDERKGPPGRTAAGQASGSKAPRRKTRGRPSEPYAQFQMKTFRFVASKLSHDLTSMPVKQTQAPVIDRGRSLVAASGTKRKHVASASPSPASSDEVTLSTLARSSRTPRSKPASKEERKMTTEPAPASPLQEASSPPQPRKQSRSSTESKSALATPKRRGRPPRPAYDIESLAPIDPDSPEAKGHFPEYRYERERGLMPCAFVGCNAQLTGKKAEMTTHLKTHFLAVEDRTLTCPWTTKNKHGEHVVCGQTFKDSANMGRHVTTRHARVEEYKCGRCGRPFSRRDAALRHMKTMCSPDRQKMSEERRRSSSDADFESEDEDNETDDGDWSMNE